MIWSIQSDWYRQVFDAEIINKGIGQRIVGTMRIKLDSETHIGTGIAGDGGLSSGPVIGIPGIVEGIDIPPGDTPV